MHRKRLRILGIRGVPAAHGGFETFAEHLAPFLAERGWDVTVYCQLEGVGPITEDMWRGVRRVNIPVKGNGAKSTIVFDWISIRHAAARSKDLCLTLGYNTAAFCALLRLKGIPNVINMDGIEWRRAKWGRMAKAWFWLNERLGCWLGNHLIADHPEIERHLSTRVNPGKITTIAYGADLVADMPVEPVLDRGLAPGKYLTLIARPEPENSVLEIVRGFSAKPRGLQLAVLGNYDDSLQYHQAIKAAAGPEVVFLGGIYDKPVVQALRYHSLAYVHGHRVGGTNPSLVEALGAGNAVIAHNNRFNRWVSGKLAAYFDDDTSFETILDRLLGEPDTLDAMEQASVERHENAFHWSVILAQYEELLSEYLPAAQVPKDVTPSSTGSTGYAATSAASPRRKS